MGHKKQVIILRHNGGRLGNQLILYFSVYAYCLNRGFSLVNYSFYEYDRYFDLNNPKGLSTFFYFVKNLNLYKAHAITYIIYKIFAGIIPVIYKGDSLREIAGAEFLLPPTENDDPKQTMILSGIEESDLERIYVDGWMFRNPVGIKQYHQQIVNHFLPKKEIYREVKEFFKAISGNDRIIGVHIRHGDYKVFRGGSLYFSEEEVFEILKSFIEKKHLNLKKTKFIVFSDANIDLSIFKGLQVVAGPGKIIHDLFALSFCDEIIGSESTFGQCAAYIGNKPLYFFDRKQKFKKQDYGF